MPEWQADFGISVCVVSDRGIFRRLVRGTMTQEIEPAALASPRGHIMPALPFVAHATASLANDRQPFHNWIGNSLQRLSLIVFGTNLAHAKVSCEAI
jgi:hypothetical protein